MGYEYVRLRKTVDAMEAYRMAVNQKRLACVGQTYEFLNMQLYKMFKIINRLLHFVRKILKCGVP
jgi:hypothetical protein